MPEQSVTLEPSESKLVSFQAVPHEARAYQVLVNGLTGSFTAIEAAPPSGEILEITWRQDAVWHTFDDPLHGGNATYRFRIRNTGGTRATFKVAYMYYPRIGTPYLVYSKSSVTIEPGKEGNLDWPGLYHVETVTVPFHLFANDTEVDSMTITATVI